LVDRIFDEVAAAAAIRKLTASLHADGTDRKVQFLVAAIPDYVDSNSGWVADETIGAIQSAMGNADFLLDRFRLIDWSRGADGSARAANDSHLHERQPGALVFRRLDKHTRNVTLAVVLLVLETPTTGVHRMALRNAMRFVCDWASSLAPQQIPKLNVIGPVFSGSIPSLAQELKHWPGEPADITVVTGSAMADVNGRVMKSFAPAPDVRYQSTAPRTSDVMKALARSLGRVNRDWPLGKRVALLPRRPPCAYSPPC
jgi:hypothetical protein